ncbi:conjugal transfer pilus assembly protein TraU [Geothermobacter ehrlichii]|uniref:Conjugal transfer pilus assembly protein TraU n=1 Tax=Geothermobacter ehrlichii TaxID=213224 RepID=A0A5D3WGW8_9BACT|nr:TraU family protein [Geothermobacter ehrlichii]TYO96785.1 conjugal transfer pilus assembly protein TraU [Geothermobacter ehrlichii]
MMRVFAACLLVLCLVSTGWGRCQSRVFNPVEDICWQCIFPVQFGGRVTLGNTRGDVPPETRSSPVCACSNGGSVTVGTTVSFYEPARMIETVQDAYCFPSLGTRMSNPQPGFLNGSKDDPTLHGGAKIFQQVHYYVLPVFQLMNLFVDFPCLEQKGFDLAYMTEADPLWSNDVLALLLNPEALLFANPASQLSCVPDSVAANTGYPIDQLFWCMGSWGSAYPLTGSIEGRDDTIANAGLAARMLFKLGREMLLFDRGTDPCGAVMTPIWKKSLYRLQIARPVRGNDCIPIGRSDFLWGAGKNPPTGAGPNAPNNFLWVLTRKNRCCIGYAP